jgi:hypothetical protein
MAAAKAAAVALEHLKADEILDAFEDDGADMLPPPSARLSQQSDEDELAGELVHEVLSEVMHTAEGAVEAVAPRLAGSWADADGAGRVLSNGCSERSDFVYDEEEEVTPLRESHLVLLHRVTAFTRVEQVREWVASASDADVLGLIAEVRYQQDAWLRSEADLINAQVKLRIDAQRATSVQLSTQMRVAAERRASGDSVSMSSCIADEASGAGAAQKVAELR